MLTTQGKKDRAKAISHLQPIAAHRCPLWDPWGAHYGSHHGQPLAGLLPPVQKPYPLPSLAVSMPGLPVQAAVGLPYTGTRGRQPTCGPTGPRGTVAPSASQSACGADDWPFQAEGNPARAWHHGPTTRTTSCRCHQAPGCSSGCGCWSASCVVPGTPERAAGTTNSGLAMTYLALATPTFIAGPAPLGALSMPLMERDAGTAQTIDQIRQLVDQGSKDPLVNRTALAIVQRVRAL